MTLKVVHRHEKLAPESDVEFMAPISGSCDGGLRLTLFAVISCVRLTSYGAV